MLIPAIYAVYATGSMGSTVALLYLGEGKIAGADIGTIKYIGAYDEVGTFLHCVVEYVLPADVPLITGESLSEERRVSLAFDLPPHFERGTVIRAKTATGAVNLRFEKILEVA